jgi:hypothetical protein
MWKEDRSMHPRTEELLDFLDSRREALKAAVLSVPRGLCERRPAPGRWSVAEVLEHLSLVEGRVTQLIAGRIDAARAEGLAQEADTSPVLPTIDLGGVLDRSRAIEASDAARPRGRMDMSAAWSAVVSTRGVLRDVVLSADGLALDNVTAPHPVLGMLNMYQWIVFVGMHEARHTGQILDAGRMLGEEEERRDRLRGFRT